MIYERFVTTIFIEGDTYFTDKEGKNVLNLSTMPKCLLFEP